MNNNHIQQALTEPSDEIQRKTIKHGWPDAAILRSGSPRINYITLSFPPANARFRLCTLRARMSDEPRSERPRKISDMSRRQFSLNAQNAHKNSSDLVSLAPQHFADDVGLGRRKANTILSLSTLDDDFGRPHCRFDYCTHSRLYSPDRQRCPSG